MSRYYNTILCTILGAVVTGLLFLAVVLFTSKNLGYSHDELWDYRDSVAFLTNTPGPACESIEIFGINFPIVTGPYQGALKAWVTAPLLHLFGSSPQVLRGLNCFFAIGYLFVLVWVAWPLLNRFSLVLLLIPVFDSNFVYNAVLDYGPFIFPNIFISLALGFLLRFYIKGNLLYFYVLCFCLGEALAQKLTVAPVVLVIGASSLIGFLRHAKRNRIKSAEFVRVSCCCVGLIMLPLIPFMLYFHSCGLGNFFAMTEVKESVSYISRLKWDLTVVSSITNASPWLGALYGDKTLHRTSGLIPLLNFCLVASAFLLVLKDENNTRLGNWSTLMFFIIVFSMLVFPLVKGLTRPWHYLVFHPLLWLSFVFINVEIRGLLAEKKFFVRCMLVLFLIAGITCLLQNAYFSLSSFRYVKKNSGVGITSPAIWKVGQWLKEQKIRRIISANYSLSAPLFVYMGGEISSLETHWTPLSNDSVKKHLNDLSQNRDTCVIVRIVTGGDLDPVWRRWLNKEEQNKRILEAFAEVENYKTKMFSDSKGTDFYLICGKE